MSVNTVKEAESLQVVCKLSYDGRYIVPAISGFVVGNIDTLETAGEWLEQMYQQRKGKGSVTAARRWIDENGPRFEVRQVSAFRKILYDRLKSRKVVNTSDDVELAARIMNRNYERHANRKPRAKVLDAVIPKEQR